MLQIVDQKRQEVSKALDPVVKSALGQFMTPAPVGAFMASLFSKFTNREIKLLDAGAGIGSLTFAFLERWSSLKRLKPKIYVDAFEIDNDLAAYLKNNFNSFQKNKSNGRFEYRIYNDDFIVDAVRNSWKSESPNYTHAILNPPYKKIHSDSEHREMLRTMGIETVNLYSAFVEVAVNKMAKGGELVVIIPRSFCNGPYYRSFRKSLLKKTAIKTIHLFDSRKRAFKDDGVLQENVIFHLVKGRISKEVLISISSDSSFSDLKQFKCDIGQILNPLDEESFIHIPTEIKKNSLENSNTDKCSLKEIGIEVSTGPVVDFRIKDNLHKMPLKGDAPLLYPAHFDGNSVKWPKKEIRKSNAISLDDETKKMLFPKGFYVLVKRFSSKEEKKRISAALLSPKEIKAKRLGFENHLNVFHIKKTGLEENVARGLTMYLNSSGVDKYFREFNGHTQVNATDLRSLKYPPIEALRVLGKMAKSNRTANQGDVDKMVKSIQ